MYTITRMRDGSFWCEGRVQDGTERWSKPTEKEAVQSMIQFARVMNNSYITKRDITLLEEGPPPPPEPVSVEDRKLLADIKSGRKKVLDFDDKRLKFRITDEECDMIVKIREGDLIVLAESPVPPVRKRTKP